MNKAIEAREWKTYAYSDSTEGKETRACGRQRDGAVRDGIGNIGQV